MLPAGPPDEETDMVQVIKERVDGGLYSVDPHVVAEAMLARRGHRNLLHSLWSEVLVATQLVAPAEPEPAPRLDAP